MRAVSSSGNVTGGRKYDGVEKDSVLFSPVTVRD